MNAEPASQAGGGRDRVMEDLRVLLGERLSTSAAVREQHGQAEAYHPSAPPDAVAFLRASLHWSISSSGTP